MSEATDERKAVIEEDLILLGAMRKAIGAVYMMAITEEARVALWGSVESIKTAIDTLEEEVEGLE